MNCYPLEQTQLQTHISSFLSIDDRFRTLYMVNKSWQNIVRNQKKEDELVIHCDLFDERNWKTLKSFLYKFSGQARIDYVQSFEKLEIRFPRFENKWSLQLLNLCTEAVFNVKYLVLCGEEEPSSIQMVTMNHILYKSSHSLKTLRLKENCETFDLSIFSLPKLEYVAIDYTDKFESNEKTLDYPDLAEQDYFRKTLQSLPPGLPKLDLLYVEGHAISDENLELLRSLRPNAIFCGDQAYANIIKPEIFDLELAQECKQLRYYRNSFQFLKSDIEGGGADVVIVTGYEGDEEEVPLMKEIFPNLKWLVVEDRDCWYAYLTDEEWEEFLDAGSNSGIELVEYSKFWGTGMVDQMFAGKQMVEVCIRPSGYERK